MSPKETADLINDLILKSQTLLEAHPFNKERAARGEDQTNSIWPWSGGYRPSMKTMMDIYPQIKSGAVISAVDLIRGIGHYAGLRNIIVEGATGLAADTNYEGRHKAAIDALKPMISYSSTSKPVMRRDTTETWNSNSKPSRTWTAVSSNQYMRK